MENKPIIVEYLIIIKQEGTFCDSDKSFLKFLGVDSSLSISETDNQITVNLRKKNKFTASFVLESGLVPSQKERYFKLTLSSKENKLTEFTELTTLLEKIITKLHPEVSINVLWNDIARKNAIEGYELINEVENLLRRLITNFMLVNVGYDWHKYHIPSSVENRDSLHKENYTDYLHRTYFSDLKTILFEGQRDFNLRDIGEVQRFIEKCISDKTLQISVDELKGVIAKSLWEKHFSKDTDYKKRDLEDDLEKLNLLRNEIAHNRHISRETLGKIQNISKKIIKALKLELEDLPNKVLTIEEQKFQVNTEISRITEQNPAFQGYFSELVVFEWYKSYYSSENINLVHGAGDMGTDIIVNLDSNKRIGVQVKSTKISGFRQIRNHIAHGHNIEGYIPKNVNDYSEFHLAIVLRDYELGIELPFAAELNSLLTGLNSKIQLIVGFIDEHNEFIQIMY